jgi:hypothetical protein
MIRRGERGWVGLGGPSWSLVGMGSSLDVNEVNAKHTPPTGDHEGPPNPASSTLAPTDVDAYGGIALAFPRCAALHPAKGQMCRVPQPLYPLEPCFIRVSEYR